MNRYACWVAMAGLALSAPALVHAQDATQPAVAAFDQLKANKGKPSGQPLTFNLARKRA